MNKEYVKKYASLEINHWWFIIRKKIIFQILAKYLPAIPNKSLKILNVGAAGGASSKWLSYFGEVYSIEYDTFLLIFYNAKILKLLKLQLLQYLLVRMNLI